MNMSSLTMLVDSREQTPLPFPDGVRSRRVTLRTGDYTACGLEETARMQSSEISAVNLWMAVSEASPTPSRTPPRPVPATANHLSIGGGQGAAWSWVTGFVRPPRCSAPPPPNPHLPAPRVARVKRQRPQRGNGKTLPEYSECVCYMGVPHLPPDTPRRGAGTLHTPLGTGFPEWPWKLAAHACEGAAVLTGRPTPTQTDRCA